MKNDFDRVAFYYDWLAKLVFGRKLKEAKRSYLNKIPKASTVLIVGGGTGELLEMLPSEALLKIDYLELSEKMLAKARSRNSLASETKFIVSDVLNHEGAYDAIIANFFLDCFSEDTLNEVLVKLKSLMKPGAQLLVTDFAITKTLKGRILNKMMHFFFRLTVNLSSSSLKDIRKILLAAGFVEEDYQLHEHSFCFSGCYRKQAI